MHTEKHTRTHTHTHAHTRLQWERVKKAGMAPGPRSSFAMVPHKNRRVRRGPRMHDRV
jgi:hypothetical protein